MEGKENKHVQAFRANLLKPDEVILLWLDGWIGEMLAKKGEKEMHNGMFILTNQRANFYRKGWFGDVFETVPISNITMVESKSIMGCRLLQIHTPHDRLAFKSFEEKELVDKAHEQIEELRRNEGVGNPSEAKHDDPYDQLKKLAELRDAGILTEEEFAAKKAEIIAKI